MAEAETAMNKAGIWGNTCEKHTVLRDRRKHCLCALVQPSLWPRESSLCFPRPLSIPGDSQASSPSLYPPLGDLLPQCTRDLSCCLDMGGWHHRWQPNLVHHNASPWSEYLCPDQENSTISHQKNELTSWCAYSVDPYSATVCLNLMNPKSITRRKNSNTEEHQLYILRAFLITVVVGEEL